MENVYSIGDIIMMKQLVADAIKSECCGKNKKSQENIGKELVRRVNKVRIQIISQPVSENINVDKVRH